MNARTNRSARSVIRDSAIRYARRAGLIDSSAVDFDDCRVADSVKQLMALGLSADEIDMLDIRQPMLQAICERTRQEDAGCDRSRRMADAVETTLQVVNDETRKLDLEFEMLALRKSALMRRTMALRKIAQRLESGDNPIVA